jgi:hypothetical protein
LVVFVLVHIGFCKYRCEFNPVTVTNQFVVVCIVILSLSKDLTAWLTRMRFLPTRRWNRNDNGD